MKLFLIFLFLISLNANDVINFAKWMADNGKNFNVVDFFIQNGEIDVGYPSLKTKIVGKKYKIVVLKKQNFDYNLSLFSYDKNKSVDFNKTLLSSTKKFDVYEIIIPFEYKKLKFVIDYNVTKCYSKKMIGEIVCKTHKREDNSTDDFSTKPLILYETKKSNYEYYLKLGNKSEYNEKRDNEKLFFYMKNGKGILRIKDKSIETIDFCLDDNWTIIDEDDTPYYKRKMPCVKIQIFKSKGWAGVGKGKMNVIELEIDYKQNRVFW